MKYKVLGMLVSRIVTGSQTVTVLQQTN